MSLIHLHGPKDSVILQARKHSEISADSVAKPFQSTILGKKCPLCSKKVSVYTTCLDCKRPIQWICYKCQWESNVRDHSSCHKNISISTIPHQKFKVENNPINLLVTKSQGAYWWTLNQITEALA